MAVLRGAGPQRGGGYVLGEGGKAMSDIVLKVDVRESKGTGGARAARREGLVPVSYTHLTLPTILRV